MEGKATGSKPRLTTEERAHQGKVRRLAHQIQREWDKAALEEKLPSLIEAMFSSVEEDNGFDEALHDYEVEYTQTWTKLGQPGTLLRIKTGRGNLGADQVKTFLALAQALGFLASFSASPQYDEEGERSIEIWMRPETAKGGRYPSEAAEAEAERIIAAEQPPLDVSAPST